MKAGRIRLLVAVILMVGWLGYLGYLALGQSKPVVISRSQLLHASHFVKAEVNLDASGKPVALVRVSESFGANRIADAEMEVDNLDDVRLPDGRKLSPGTYFLPVMTMGSKKYRVVSPSGSDSSKAIAYPWTGEVEKQVRELVR